MRWSFAVFFGLLLVTGLAALLFYPYGQSRQPSPPVTDQETDTARNVSPPHQFVLKKDEPAAEEQTGTEPTGDEDDLLTLEWEDMIPLDWEPDLYFDEYDIDLLDDDDDLAIELMDKLEEVWAAAPVVEDLDGRRVRLPGFAVPLDAKPGTVSEFLLVPYFGACIHVPPPPANQIVYIKSREPDMMFELELFDTVWVKGTMQTQSFTDDELGKAGYTIIADGIEPYEDDSVINL